MLRFALEYRKAIDTITADKTWKLRRFELDGDEWQVVRDLVGVLEVSENCALPLHVPTRTNLRQQYKKATLFFSKDSAGIAAVIPAMDKLNSTFDPQTKKAYHPAIKAAMKLGHAKLNRYYSMTDLSHLYRIAMGT